MHAPRDLPPLIAHLPDPARTRWSEGLADQTDQVDQSVAVSVGSSASVPGFRTRKVKTNVTVRHGETIVLSGVFSHDEQKSVSKIPGLGHIPIIGELFKNRAFDSNKRELVIFVTPRIVGSKVGLGEIIAAYQG